MKRAALAAAGLTAALLLVLVVKAAGVRSRQPAVEAATPIAVDADALAQRLAGAVAFATIVAPDGAVADPAPFVGLRAYLDATWPGATSGLTRERVAEHSLLYTWRGLDPDLPPLLLLAHQDVVPVPDEALAAWTHPPFAGTVADGFVWGRGTMDDKVAIVGILEAVDALWRSGFRPRRSVLFAFGHDEEVSGSGARALADLLRRRGVRPLLVLDEGLAVTHGLVPGLTRPAALVGLAEKGYLTVELTASGEGGHSSMPPEQTAVGILAAAVARLEASPLPPHGDGPMDAMFDWLAPEMGFGERLVFANRWLFDPVVTRVLLGAPTTAATVRTTTAVTMFAGGVKENVLPPEARATVNFRIFPGESAEDVLRHVERAVDDPRVAVAPSAGFRSEASPVSTTESDGFALLTAAIRASFPDAVVAPGMSVGATDARAYVDLTDSVYRFSPLRLHKSTGDPARLHGVDERVSVENLAEAARFYAELIRRAAM